MKESCDKYEWVTGHIWMSHMTHMNESCDTYGWVTGHIRRITYRMAKMHTIPYLYRGFSTKEPCNQWFFCGKRPATHTNEARDTYVESWTEWRRCIQCLICIGYFLQKSHIISGSCAERDQQHIRMSHVTHTSSHVQNGEGAHNVLSL